MKNAYTKYLNASKLFEGQCFIHGLFTFYIMLTTSSNILCDAIKLFILVFSFNFNEYCYMYFINW